METDKQKKTLAHQTLPSRFKITRNRGEEGRNKAKVTVIRKLRIMSSLSPYGISWLA